MMSLLMTPKPYHDESLAGYIVRLTEKNFYERTGDIYVMSGLSKVVQGRSNNGNLLNPFKDNFKRICELTNCSIRELGKLTFSDFPVNSVSSFQFNNVPISKELILLKKTKVCPECLKESAYHRKHWDLVPVTACIYHFKVLVDRCPNCKKEISWLRTKVLECKCGKILSDISTINCTPEEVKVSSLFYNIGSAQEPSQDNKLISLNIDEIYGILTFFSWFLVEKNEKWGFMKHIGKSRTNQEIHDLFSKIYEVFNNWPRNFYIFLDELNKISIINEDDTSMKNHFGLFYDFLHEKLNTEKMKFILREFDEYLAKRWSGGYITSLRRSSSKNLNRKYISAQDVYDDYRITTEYLKKIIKIDMVKGVIKKRGESVLILVEKESIEKYLEKIKEAYTRPEIATFLNINEQTVNELEKIGCVEALKGPSLDGWQQWLYSKESVEKLFNDIQFISRETKNYSDENIISFRQALRTASGFNCGIGHLVKAIQEKQVIAIRYGEGRGLDRLEFPRDEVYNYFFGLRFMKEKDHLFISELVKILEVKNSSIIDWMKKGFLSYEGGASKKYRISKQEFDSFIKTYIPLSIVAKKLNTVGTYLYKKLLNSQIVAVTGPQVDGGQQYLYLKSEIDYYLEEILGQPKINL